MVGPPPLSGLKVLEFAGLAPGPFAGMLLADSGASVLRIDRPAPTGGAKVAEDMLSRRKASIAVDLKQPRGAALVRRLASAADVLIDPFRPGVLERLGLGPEELLAANGRLIYARISGFRRGGRYGDMAGHDINYLAVSGTLALLGREGQRPTPPWNILADFAGGGAALFQGILLALVARSGGPVGGGVGGRGQVVEANMVDGSAYLASFPRLALKTHLGSRPRGQNLLDSGCPYYDTYETAEAGKYVAVGALEPQFFAELIRGLGLGGQGWEERRHNPESWGEMRGVFEEVFRTKTRAEWEAIFDGTDACCTPVLEFGELERDRAGGREGDQRPPVGLRDTPLLAVHENVMDPAAQGQGPGVPGGGYVPSFLRPGQGGEGTLREWLGWTKGRQYDVLDGGLVLSEKAKM